MDEVVEEGEDGCAVGMDVGVGVAVDVDGVDISSVSEWRR